MLVNPYKIVCMFSTDRLKKKSHFSSDFHATLKNSFPYYLSIVNYCWNCRGLKDSRMKKNTSLH